LLDKLAALNERLANKLDINKIEKAIYYAKKYHGQQKRQSGEPYYSHPLEVAFMLSDYLFTESAIITAILHDTLEDTKLTFHEIKEEFGKKVASQVLLLTRKIDKYGNKAAVAETISFLMEKKEHETIIVKIFDRMHNIQTIKAKPPEKIKKITQETLEIFVPLCAQLQFAKIKKQLISSCLRAVLFCHTAAF
jgi:(p)ppGpp synthase/HD superfamily hydrolase